MRVLSLGAGVQSSTLLLMAARGELVHTPDCAIFADTGWEPPHVYEWLAFLEDQVRDIIPIHRVSAGDLRSDVLARERRNGQPPFFVLSAGGSGREAMIRRQCTREYKIEPITRKVRELVGIAPRMPGPRRVVAEQWMGISLDELVRAKPSRVRWIENRFPLLDRGMTRRDCLDWMERRRFPRPPKSSCIGCPYHSDAQWREMRENDPASWADAVEFDRQLRIVGVRGIVGEPFLHRTLRPLDEVDLATAEERGQGNLFDHPFAAECEGMCGI